MKIEVIDNERIKVTNDAGEEREIDLEELFGDPQEAKLARLAKRVEVLEKDKKEVTVIREIHRDYPRIPYQPYPSPFPRPFWWYGACQTQLTDAVSSDRTTENVGTTINGLVVEGSQVIV